MQATSARILSIFPQRHPNSKHRTKGPRNSEQFPNFRATLRTLPSAPTTEHTSAEFASARPITLDEDASAMLKIS